MLHVRFFTLLLALSVSQGSFASSLCSKYETNEYRVVSRENFSGFIGGHTIGYVTQKVSENKYKIFFDLDFWGSYTQQLNSSHDQYIDNILDIQNQNKKEESDLRNFLKTCFIYINSSDFGDGTTRFELHQIDHNYTGPMPKRIRLNINRQESHRTNSREYSSRNLSCQTIIHEVLHLSGLWDEYVEPYLVVGFMGVKNGKMNDKKAYNCRSNSDSIMSNSSDYRFTNSGFIHVNSEATALRPAHIRELLFPGCPGNETYRACVRNAYETSEDHGGKGCKPAPEVCSTFNKWLE